ncbi:hypothetical protein JOB18_003397, partial [Solea senegalensis]
MVVSRFSGALIPTRRILATRGAQRSVMTMFSHQRAPPPTMLALQVHGFCQ